MAIAFAVESALVWKTSTTGNKAAGGAAIAVLFVYMGLFTVCRGMLDWMFADIPDGLPGGRLVLFLRNHPSSS